MLVFSICTALANLITDGIVFGRLLRGELKVSSEIYMAAYATILCFGVVATAFSLGYRIRNARLMRAQLQQIAPQGQEVATSVARRQLQQHVWELAQTHRTKVTLLLSLSSLVAQGAFASQACAFQREADRSSCATDLPMSALNCCLLFVEESCDKTVRRFSARLVRAHDGAPSIAHAHSVRSSRRFWYRCCCSASS
jgi:hypothetical protein